MSKPVKSDINDPARVAWRVNEYAAAISVCPNTVHNLIASGKIKAKKVGRATLIITPPSELLAAVPDVR